MADDSRPGTGRLAIIYGGTKRRRGKPALDRRIVRGQIVADVESRQRAEPAVPVSHHIEAAADAFGCEARTVYRARAVYGPVAVEILGKPVVFPRPTVIAVDPPPNRRARLPAGVKWGSRFHSASVAELLSVTQ
jgi:hypothetical protein